MKTWYVVGMNTLYTENTYPCSSYDEHGLLLGITSDKTVLSDYVNQYNHIVDFEIMTFDLDDGRCDDNSYVPIREILYEFNVPTYVGINRNNIELIRGNTDTIHPTNWVFTLYQHDAFLSNCIQDMCLDSTIHEFVTSVVSILTIVDHINDSIDLRKFMIQLFARYLMISEACQYNELSKSKSLSLAEFIGYDTDQSQLCNYLSPVQLVKNWLLEWGY